MFSENHCGRAFILVSLHLDENSLYSFLSSVVSWSCCRVTYFPGLVSVLERYGWGCIFSHIIYGRQRILLFHSKWKGCWSKNHRAVQVGRELWGLSRPHPPHTQSRVSMLFRAVSSWIFDIFKDGGSTVSLGNLFQGLTILTVKKFFLTFRWSFLHFHLCPLPVVLSLGITKTNLAPSHPLTGYFYILIRLDFLPMSFLFSRLSNPSFQLVCNVTWLPFKKRKGKCWEKMWNHEKKKIGISCWVFFTLAICSVLFMCMYICKFSVGIQIGKLPSVLTIVDTINTQESVF